ncbi:MAG: glycosyltransferase family 4 protein [Phreatobacter sp.]
MEALARRQMEAWKSLEQGAADPLLPQIEAFLADGPGAPETTRIAAPRPTPPQNRRLALETWGNRLYRQIGAEVPRGAIYVNVAQHFLEMPFLFRWLARRPDVVPVFFLHDILPIEFPEYFPAERKLRFPRILATALSRGRALIVTCETTGERIRRYARDHGHGPVPVHVAPLPADDALHIRPDPGRPVDPVPFVMAIGTVEPRKNHLLLLHLWRRFAERSIAAPKLLIVGHIGWNNEMVLDMLDRSPGLRGRVLQVSGLSDAACRQLLGRARALLAASFSEGYGIPLVEALTSGVPVICSDIPVFREITQGVAEFCHPLDGPGWERAILRHMTTGHSLAARAGAAAFNPPTWERYFDDLLAFLAGL